MDHVPKVYDIDWWRSKDYETLRDEFEWVLPESMNMGVACADRHQGSNRTALVYNYPDNVIQSYSYDDLIEATNRFANYYRDLGVERGDVVAVCLPQCPQNPIAHIAAWKVGAVSMPLTKQFGPRALSYRLENSEAVCAVVDEDQRERFETIEADLDRLSAVLPIEPAPDKMSTVESEVKSHSSRFDPVETGPTDPAMVIFSSGTTGQPKGIVHGHRVLPATIPGFLMTWNNLDHRPDDVFWTPAAWAWGGALLNYVFPPLYYGNKVVASYRNSGFDAEWGYEMLERHGVSKTFLPATALRMLMQVDNPAERYDLDALSVIGSGGEQLGIGPYNWVREQLDNVVVNEMFGQTEAHAFLGSCTELFDTKPGSVGRPVVGHEVRIVDDEGEPLPVGEKGQIAVKITENPIMMLYFLSDNHSVDDRLHDGWWLTGDIGFMDEEEYFTIVGREDNIIISSGYRIGPEEVEDVLCEVKEVQNCAVVGVPDDTRGEIVKAFVQVANDTEGDEQLVKRLQEHAKQTLAMYEYPREIEFVDSFPTTPSGKIKRHELRS